MTTVNATTSTTQSANTTLIPFEGRKIPVNKGPSNLDIFWGRGCVIARFHKGAMGNSEFTSIYFRPSTQEKLNTLVLDLLTAMYGLNQVEIPQRKGDEEVTEVNILCQGTHPSVHRYMFTPEESSTLKEPNLQPVPLSEEERLVTEPPSPEKPVPQLKEIPALNAAPVSPTSG